MPIMTIKAPTAQRGYTLIEILIALLIGLFLLGALLTIVQTNRAVFGNQTQLALLHDSERMAMALMTDVIQSAGYFPDPHINTSATLTASGSFAAAKALSARLQLCDGDTLSVRFVRLRGDSILNCSGEHAAVGTPLRCTSTTFDRERPARLHDERHSVQPRERCSHASNPLGVTNMSVLYGVKTAATLGNNVDTYFDASQMTGGGISVISVR